MYRALDTDMTTASDHDLLIRIDERMDSLYAYIMGSEGRVGLAARVRSLERWRWIVYGTGGEYNWFS